MPPKGWTAGREATEVKAVRLSKSLIERITQHVERLQAQFRFGRINEGMAIRDLIEIGLDTVEGSAAQPIPATQPAIPLALEPAPAAEVQPKPTRTSKAPSARAQRGLPQETLQQIADEYTLCEGLSLSEFAQRLFDKNIYRTTSNDGTAVPAHRGTLKKWLERARQEGML
jgi:hypothetical protein